METSIIKSLFKWFCDCEILEADSVPFYLRKQRMLQL